LSLQVSYKKQFVIFVLLAIIFLTGVEVLVNIWLYTIYRCDFEDNEIFKDIDPQINRKVCLESIGYGFTKEKLSMVNGTHNTAAIINGKMIWVAQGLDENVVSINNDGFRGSEFTEVKQDNTYRIFAVGGSTTFGAGVLDDQTYPFYLQELYDDTNLGLKVEVINAGWAERWSLPETAMIKNDLINFEPNLFIIYDGWNDLIKEVFEGVDGASAIEFKERWLEICGLGKQLGFDVIISLQPLAGTGKKVLTEQEYEAKTGAKNQELFDVYPSYVKQLDALGEHCYLAVDLRGLFDYEKGPIYYDHGHTGPRGNQIIAQKFYSLSLPLLEKTIENPDFSLDIGPVRESNTRLVSNDYDVFLDRFYFTTRDLISNYMTPRIFPLIFQH